MNQIGSAGSCHPLHQKKLWTLEETAIYLNVSYARAAELARTGLIAGVVHLGRQIRIDPVSLQSHISAGGQALAESWRRDGSQRRLPDSDQRKGS